MAHDCKCERGESLGEWLHREVQEAVSSEDAAWAIDRVRNGTELDSLGNCAHVPYAMRVIRLFLTLTTVAATLSRGPYVLGQNNSGGGEPTGVSASPLSSGNITNQIDLWGDDLPNLRPEVEEHQTISRYGIDLNRLGSEERDMFEGYVLGITSNGVVIRPTLMRRWLNLVSEVLTNRCDPFFLAQSQPILIQRVPGASNLVRGDLIGLYAHPHGTVHIQGESMASYEYWKPVLGSADSGHDVVIKKVAPDPAVTLVDWLRSRAAEGSARAQYELAVRYRDGNGVPKDQAEAKRLLEQSAEQGFEKAQVALKVIK